MKAHRSLPTLTDPSMVQVVDAAHRRQRGEEPSRGRDRRRRRDERYGSWVVSPPCPIRKPSALDADDARRLSLALGSHRCRAIARCSPIGTSPGCRKPRRQRQSEYRSARSSRELLGHSSRLRTEMERRMIDLERSLERARRTAGDPRRRVAGRRRRPSHRRTARREPSVVVVLSASRLVVVAVAAVVDRGRAARSAPRRWPLVGVRQRAHRTGRHGADDAASTTSRSTVGTSATTIVPGTGPRSTPCRSTKRCADRSARSHADVARAAAVGPRRASRRPAARSCWCTRRRISFRSPRSPVWVRSCR